MDGQDGRQTLGKPLMSSQKYDLSSAAALEPASGKPTDRPTGAEGWRTERQLDDPPIPPHGGVLVNLLAEPDRADELRKASTNWPSWELTPRQLCDLELLLSGAFSPLVGFLGETDHRAVCESMRLADGTLWPIPVVLDVDDDMAGALGDGSPMALRDPEGTMLAALQ